MYIFIYFPQEPITSSLEGQYLISEYRHFSQAGETLAHKLYCDCLFYLCLLQSQRMAQVQTNFIIDSANSVKQLNQCCLVLVLPVREILAS